MATMPFESLRLPDLPQRGCEVLRRASSTRPAVWLVEDKGFRAVVKDFSSNRFLYRNTVGRFLVWREKKAYRRLEGLKGIPILYRDIDGLALVVEEVKGRSLENLEEEIRLSDGFFDMLRVLVKNVHERGLAHCDLKRVSNVLLGDDGKPHIVDWSSSISKREFRIFPLNTIYQRFLLDDFNAIIKIQLRHRPESISSEEKKYYHQRSRAEKFVRAIRDKARALLQKVA